MIILTWIYLFAAIGFAWLWYKTNEDLEEHVVMIKEYMFSQARDYGDKMQLAKRNDALVDQSRELRSEIDKLKEAKRKKKNAKS